MSDLPPLAPALPITSDGTAASAQFIQFWLRFKNAIQAALAGLQSQETATASLLAQVQAAQQQQAAQLVLVNEALQAAQNPSSSGKTQTQAGSVSIGATDTSWELGPVATFSSAVASTNVVAGASCGPTTAGNFSGNSTLSGNVRLQRILGGVETTIGTGTFSIKPPVPAQDGDPAIPAVLHWTGFGSLSPNVDSGTGSISYRVDLQRNSGGGSAGIGVTTSVTRN